MTNGTAAAMILSDTILGRDNPWADFFDGDRLKRGASTALDDLAPGEDRLLRLGGGRQPPTATTAGACTRCRRSAPTWVATSTGIRRSAPGTVPATARGLVGRASSFRARRLVTLRRELSTGREPASRCGCAAGG